MHFKQRRDAVAWRAGEKLNIGHERPFWRIKEALYRVDVPRIRFRSSTCWSVSA